VGLEIYRDIMRPSTTVPREKHVSKEVFVFDVNQKSFDQAVLLNSHKIPVIVEFMGV